MTTIATITAIGNIIMVVDKYGAPAVQKILDELDRKGDPTLAEIEALGEMMQDPEAYFNRPSPAEPV